MQVGLQDNVIPTAMRTGLDNDVYVFSALKTHAQLYEASRLLTDANGKVKSFEIFANDVKKLNVQHNEQYLEAEYRFAVSSATMAGRWAAIEADGDTFNLQYRTAGDDRVRDSHAAIDLVTLAPSDPFWSSYFPPNGWRCRCNAVQVRKSKFETSDPVDAITKAEKATTQIGKDGKNRLEIFRFNPGKDKVIFPPHHPYRLVQDAYKVAGDIGKSATKETKRLVFEKPVDEQYKNIYKSKSGGSVEMHELVGPDDRRKDDDFINRIEAARVFAEKGFNVKILPEIHKDDRDFRQKMLPNYTNFSKNPDFLIDGQYVELKRPKKLNNIGHNANKSVKQESISLIMNEALNLNREIAKEKAELILKNENYTYDVVHFIFKSKLYTYKIEQGVILDE